MGRIADIQSYSEAIKKVAKEHGTIAFPTDTVNGIGCSPYDEAALKKLFRIKKRRGSKAFPVLVSSIGVAGRLAYMNAEAKLLAKSFWPGGLTLVLPLKDRSICRQLVKDGKMGIRLPDSKLVLALARLFGGSMVGTSANISGKPVLNIDEAEDALPELGIVIKYACRQSGKPSTLFDVSEMKILREGSVTQKDIERALGSALPTSRSS